MDVYTQQIARGHQQWRLPTDCPFGQDFCRMMIISAVTTVTSQAIVGIGSTASWRHSNGDRILRDMPRRHLSMSRIKISTEQYNDDKIVAHTYENESTATSDESTFIYDYFPPTNCVTRCSINICCPPKRLLLELACCH